jgi:uncharacterized membrane protein
MPGTVLAILYLVHLLAAVALIGGLVILLLVVIPGTRRALSDTGSDQTSAENLVAKLLTEFERRFTPLANLSLVVLVATGMLQMSADDNYDGFLQFSNTWAWAMIFKHLAFLGMVMIAGYVALALEPERRRLRMLQMANRPDERADQQLSRRRARLTLANLVFGLLTLAFTAIATAQ